MWLAPALPGEASPNGAAWVPRLAPVAYTMLANCSLGDEPEREDDTYVPHVLL